MVISFSAYFQWFRAIGRSKVVKVGLNTKLARFEEAEAIYSKLASSFSKLKDYTQFKLAKIYIERGNEDKSIVLLKKVLNEFPQSRLYPHVKFLMAKIYYGRNEFGLARKLFAELSNNYSKSDLMPETIFYTGLILEKQNKITSAYETYAKLFHSFPLDKFSIEAEEKLRELKSLNSKLKDFSPDLIIKRIDLLIKDGEYSLVARECKKYLKTYKKGMFHQSLTFKLAGAYLSMKKRKEALAIYNSLLNKNPSSPFAPEVFYKIANIYWNLGQYGEAIKYCKITIKKYPSNSFAEKSHYVISRIFEQKKEYSEGISNLKKMVAKFPNGKYVDSGYWRIGWLNYLKEDYKLAARAFSDGADLFLDSYYRDMFLYWAGKSNEKMGKHEAAYKLYKQAATEYPYDFYGHRGKAKLGNNAPDYLTKINPFLERKLKTAPVKKDFETKGSIKDHFHYLRAKELAIMGLYEDALDETKMIAKHVSVNTPEKILMVANLYLQAKGYFNAFEIMEGFFNDISHKKRHKLSKNYWERFFPLAYKEIVYNSSLEFNVDPFFIEGVMRQESIFDANSFSKSGAIGLMQLMPETGKREYIKKFGGDFFLESLYSPEINISLGAQHLAYLLKRTKGNPILSLAGYNAGLSRAFKWQNRIKTSDPDVFIERIPFRETRWYVKKALRNYFNYMTLYDNMDNNVKAFALKIKD